MPFQAVLTDVPFFAWGRCTQIAGPSSGWHAGGQHPIRNDM